MHRLHQSGPRAPSLYLDVLETLPLDHRLGLHTRCRLSWDDDWSLFASETPVLILLDLDDLSVPLATALRRVQERFEESAILVATADAALGAQAIARGADELITDVTAHETGLRLQTAIESHSRSLGHRREHSELRAELISLSARTQRDALTGLYTRSAFLSQVDRALSRARRLNTMVAVVYFDLDGFKTVNDSHGHHAGDAVLSWFAQALLEQFRCEDCLGRMGGDEFVLLLEDLEHPIHAFASAKKIRKLLQGELVIEDVLMELDASVGISMYPKSPDTQALISHADMAMYAAKKRPEDGKVRFFDARLEAQLIARESCRLRLEGKLARRRCSLALQPLYDYESGQLNSVEALFRWPFSETTQEVIEFAERQGFIQRLDMQMLEEAIKAFQKLRKKAPHYQKLHVNASVLSLDIHYREQVVRLLDTHLMDPAQLCIEVTETALSQDYEQLAKDLRGLRKLGLELALDDFGTGYASLRYLRDLSFHSLKLDRELVSKIGDDHRCRALCHASIDMAKSLQIKVTGEGVESSDQFSLLREMGCDFAQGYYLARPSSPEALANSDPLEFVF
ncbi:MAG: bifunctional diguanylate cyclase/phosphodiesterase [Pseudomonadota bacterium]